MSGKDDPPGLVAHVGHGVEPIAIVRKFVSGNVRQHTDRLLSGRLHIRQLHSDLIPSEVLITGRVNEEVRHDVVLHRALEVH